MSQGRSASIDARHLTGQIPEDSTEDSTNRAAAALMGAVALGDHSYAVLGLGKDGAEQVAFLGGMFQTWFAEVSQFVGKGPLYAFASASRTPQGGVEAGVVGVVTSAVQRVTVERADRTVTLATLLVWGRSPYASFTVATAKATALPRVVRAYDRSGVLVALEKLPTEPIKLDRTR
jgi:hypothetical protein